MSRGETKRVRIYEEALKLAKGPGADYVAIEPLLTAAHKAGDARATYALATWHLHGRVFKKNKRKAVALLREAAEKNVAEAVYDLAVCYEEGESVRKSVRRAAALYLRAALLGDRQSVYEIGRCYFYGIGVAQDRRIARLWLDRAGELGIDEPDDRAGLHPNSR